MKKLFGLLLITTCSLQSFANSSLYDVKVNNVRLYDKFVQAGAPKPAVERIFEFLDVNGGKTVKVEAKFRSRLKTFMSDKDVKIKESYAAIIDFSKPSNEKRLFVMNLKTGEVTKHLVAHGKGSGVTVPVKFSNVNESKMTSLGLYLAGDTYKGKHGQSLNLYGLEASNSKAARRDIVMHSAKYVSEDYAKSQGRIGRSWGCPAVAPAIIGKTINLFNNGGVIYAYHKDVNAKTLKNPNVQVVAVDHEDDIDLPGEEETMRKGEKEADELTDEEVGEQMGKLTKIPVPTPRPGSESEVTPTAPAITAPAVTAPAVTAEASVTAPTASVSTEPATVEEAIAAAK